MRLLQDHYLYSGNICSLKSMANCGAYSDDLIQVETIRDAVKLPKKIFSHIEEGNIVKRLSRGDIAVIASIDDEFAGMLWGRFGDCFVNGIGTYVGCGKTGSYFYNVYVAPDFRKKGVLGNLMSCYCELCLNMGVEKIFAFVSNNNMNMNNFMQKYFTIFYRIITLSLLDYRLTIRRSYETKNFSLDLKKVDFSLNHSI